MPFPVAIEPERVGEYPAQVNSGAGYFFDHVLEYRVWCHPERGAPDEFEGNDYFYCFATYEDALVFSEKTIGAEKPLALVRQLEWVNELEDGVYVHERGERITEWRAEWLSRGARKPGEIEAFIRSKAN